MIDSPPAKHDELAMPRRERIVSVDALRGFVMFWIIGGDLLAKALVPLGKNSSLIHSLAEQLTHVQWQGFRFYDAIFPMFLFLVGVSIVLSLDRIVAEQGRAGALRRILSRSALLFVIGVLYSGGLARAWPDVTLAGVLQRIALCYLFAAVLHMVLSRTGVAIATVLCLVGYGLMLCYVPYADVNLKHATLGKKGSQAEAKPVEELLAETPPSTQGGFEEGRNLANYVDFRWLPGRKRNLYYTNEGLLSTISALATTLFGVMAGWVLTSSKRTVVAKSRWLIVAGLLGIALGLSGEAGIPVIKRIWTPTYCLLASGCASVALGLFSLVIDAWQYRKWCLPFLWIGANAITLYLFVNIVDCEELAKRFVGGDVAAWFDSSVRPGCGTLVIAVVALSLPILLARFLYQRKIFIRL